MVKARDRRASKSDNKALRSLVERLLQLLHALARQSDQLVHPPCAFQFNRGTASGEG
jgi:hypothetical protein